MKFSLITLFPEMFTALNYGILGRAKNRGLVSWDFWNPRDYTDNPHRKVDDATYGGGSGMVMQAQPLHRTIEAARNSNGQGNLIYLTPQGTPLDNPLVLKLAAMKTLYLVAGRYEGIDERLMELEPGLEISIGDYILSGGELAAMVLIDAITRQIPGAIDNNEAASTDSFAAGLLEYPHYTRPETINELAVPDLLLGGDHAKIARWRRKQALGRTWLKRNDLLQKIELTEADTMLLNEFIKESS
jgi:tRNA (guanine37-N1)-methyltransferase